MSRISRRTWLKTFAGLSAASCFGGLLSNAIADADGAPLRFVVLHNPHGNAPVYWRPRAPGGGPASATGWVLDYDPDASMGPLEKHKDSLLVIDSLDWKVLNQSGACCANSHHGGEVSMLTGSKLRGEDDRRPYGPSIDYAIAQLLTVDQFLYVQQGYEGNSTASTYDLSGNSVPMIWDHGDLWDYWFGDFTPPDTTPNPAEEHARKAKTDASLASIEYLKTEADILRKRLAGPERQKLDAHIAALELLEKKIGAAALPVLAKCEKPAQVGNVGDPAMALDVAMQMLAMALACNLTRVGTLAMDAGSKMSYLDLPAHTDIHNQIVHMYSPDDDATARHNARIQRWYAERVATFIDLLKAIPEGTGTVYDHTVILWANDLGDAAQHHTKDVPIVVAGGGGTHAQGTYLPLEGDARAHNRLLTSLANEFGAGLSQFGDPAFPGELPGYGG